MEKRVLAVLRSGGDFRPEHVQAMQRQIARHAPNAELVCMSDVDVPGVRCARLKYDWPDWWCKMEIFRPDIRGDFLLTDLDNVFVGSIDDILSVEHYTTQVGESNALAYMTEDMRAAVWEEWIRDPKGHMHKWSPKNTPHVGQFGDGGFVKAQLHAKQHWEELFPGQLINIGQIGADRHGRTSPMLRWPNTTRNLPPEARVVLCWRPHRPWKLPMFRDLYQIQEK